MIKQILILEELGIDKLKFDKITTKAGINYEFIWSKDNINTNLLEGIITVKSKIDLELINQFPNLKFIAVAFTGYDCVDIEACNQKNISVFNVPDYSTNSVAELVIAQAISLLREIPKANNIVLNKEWKLKPGLELFGKTIGIIGTGKIGVTTAKYFKIFGCKLIAWSRTENEEFIKIGTYLKDRKDVFSRADIISVHLPLNKDTIGIIGGDELSAMKKTSYLINSARAQIVNKQALINILKNNLISGAAIDVFENEPIDPTHPLLNLINVILTPHIAYKTEEALIRRAEITIKNILDFNNKIDNNKVN